MIVITGIILFNSIILAAGACFAKETKQVAILPFVMNSAQDLSFLQNGIFDMFSSRLTHGDEVTVMTKEERDKRLSESGMDLAGDITDNRAKKIGQALGVDYVVYGSLTLFGQSMSLDVKMADMTSQTPGLDFFRQSDNLGAVIPELNAITTEINYKVFGRRPETFMAEQQTPAPGMHGGYDGTGNPLVNSRHIFTSSDRINGIASADVNGNGKNEIIVIYDHAMEIFTYAMNGQLTSVKKIDDSHTFLYIGVDAIDLNDNGYAEIFLTRLRPEIRQVSSYVVEFDGSDYQKGAREFPFYFRAVSDDKGKPEKLFAQAHGKKGPYVPLRVFEVEPSGGTYVQGNSLRVPDGFNVLSLTSGNLQSTEQEQFIFTDEKGRLKSFNDSGRVNWTSDDGYGGSELSYKFKHRPNLDDLHVAYFQPRSLLYDIGQDGNPNLLVIKNNEASDYLFKGFRQFKNGVIEILDWSELGLSMEKAPRKLPGMITDIQIADIDNNSNPELIISFVESNSGLLKKKTRSVIVAYDL